MQMFKQLITKQYEKFIQHEFNGRFFPEEFYHAWMMATVVLSIEEERPTNKERIIELNITYIKLKQKIREAAQQLPPTTDAEKKTWKETRRQELAALQQNMLIKLQQATGQDAETINKFFDKYQHVNVEEEPIKYQVNTAGVIGIVYPSLTYEKTPTRR